MGNSSGKPVVLTDEVNLNHFRLLRVVGKGAFGKVRIVERKDTGLTFALKYIRKDEIVRSESVRNIIRERRMLQQLNHPFLCNLRYSFQDMEYLYIVVDLMNGGDLRFHITRKTFTEDAVRFWVAELACALRYIHQKGIVHRDLKPDNVLLDSDGHVHLADFNVASDFTPERRLTSKSGTLAYLAPEVYEGRGYTCEVDWWSLGVTFYECIYNKRPFEGSTQDSLKRRIVEAKPPFPTTNPPVSQPCLHGISSLLEKDKRKRIGAAGFHTFTANAFFQPIDFEALERKEIEPIFKPSADKTNFDATYDLEELLLEEAPLEARARRQKPREQLKDDATQEEIRREELHRMIEQLFEPFNYTTAAYDRVPLTLGTETPTGTHSEPLDFASIPYMATAPHITFDKSTRGDRDRDRERERDREHDRLAKTRDRSVTDYSSARSTPVRTRSDTHSPNGSPPLQVWGSGHHPTTDSQGPPTPTHDEQHEYFSRANPHDAQLDALPPNMSHRSNRRGGSATPEPPPVPHDQQYNHYARGVSPEWTHGHPSQQARRPQHRPGKSGSASMLRSGSNGGPMQDLADFTHGGGHQLSHKDSASGLHHLTPNSSFVGGGAGAVGGGADLGDEKLSSRPSGMLGFLNRKKGRDRSPRGEERERSGKKGKERERGVLGKEGARVVVGHG